MRRLILKLILFVSLALGLILSICLINSHQVEKLQFANDNTESNLFFIKDSQTYDLGFVGISHARNFSRNQNQSKIEQKHSVKIINIGQGKGACSINEQLFYLRYFFNHHNRIKNLIIVLSPPMLYSKELPLASNTFVYEPLRLDFLTRYIFYEHSQNKFQRTLYYLKSKCSKDWLTYAPSYTNGINGVLQTLDTVEVIKGFAEVYPTENPHIYLNKNIGVVEEIIKLSIKNKAKVSIIIPPALFGKWKYHNEVIQAAKILSDEYKTSLYDFSESVLEPRYYYDHHHLNTNGTIYFVDSFLAPAMH